MTATRMATLDGTWELHPMIVLQPVEPHRGIGFTINYEDVIHLLELIDEEGPGIENDGFVINLGITDGDTIERGIVELPPGEPARNAIAAFRWFAEALTKAGPMPYTGR